MSHAPSAGALQAYEVVVVREPERRRRLARAAGDQEFVAEAPVMLAVFMDPARSRARYSHAAGPPEPVPRRPLDDLVRRETFR